MPEVTMDLAELDGMRDTIKAKDVLIEDLKSKEKKVIITRKVNKDDYTVHINDELHRSINSLSRGPVSRSSIARHVSITFNNDIGLDTKTEYTNLETAQKLIKDELDLEYNARIQQLIKDANSNQEKLTIQQDSYETKIIKLNQDFDKERDSLISKHSNELEELQTANEDLVKIHEETYTKLSDEFKDFKANKKRVSLEEEIGTLKEELRIAKLPWYKSKK